jgi:hypothetical protein
MWHRRVGRRGSLRAVVAAAAVALLPCGCIGYSFRAPYNEEVRTVYVPVFRSITFRRDVNLQLTELVVKEIERRTPYKVVGTREDADTILDGTINFADKNLVVENPFNYPRQLQASLSAAVNWTHNPPLEEELDRPPTIVTENVNFVPEIGETSMTAFYKANQRMAQQIVDMMEKAW